MNSTEKNILFSYYGHSYLKRLNRKWHHKIYNELNLERGEIIDSLLKYQQFISPEYKAGPLLSAICNFHPLPVTNVLDFGCGNCYFLNYLVGHINTIKYACAVDSDQSVLMKCKYLFPKIDYYSIINNVLPYDSFDLITTIHTLHHIDYQKQVAVLLQLNKLLKKGALLYIYEDSWGTGQQTSFEAFKNLDDSFYELSLEEKQKLYLLNELYSNKLCYKRECDVNKVYYRTLGDWLSLLTDCSFRILDYNTIGFDFNRLHGVPSSWIIADKI